MQVPLKALTKTLERSQSIIVLCPDAPENGGSIAAGLALSQMLQAMDKTVLLCIPSDGGVMKFLDTSSIIKTSIVAEGDFVITLKTKNATVDHVRYVVKPDHVDLLITPGSGSFSAEDIQLEQGPGHTDTIITLGTESLRDLGDTFLNYPELFTQTPIINIDTSTENEYYGAINWVDIQAASVCEMVAEFMHEAEFMTQEVATMLMAGIIYDTNNMSHGAKPQTLEVVGRLIDAGGMHTKVIDMLDKNKSRETVQLWGALFANLQMSQTYKFAWTQVKRMDFEAIGATEKDFAGVMDNTVRHLQGADCAVLVYETGSGASAMIRSNKKSVPLRRIFTDPSWEIMPTKHGINVTSNNSISVFLEALQEAWKVYAQGQYGISGDTPMDLMKLEKVTNNNIKKSAQHKTSQRNKPLAPPENIPFDAPELR